MEELKNRLRDIENRIEDLNEERKQIGRWKKWSSSSVEELIRQEVERIYGKGVVKLALLKVNSSYNDEYYDYSPVLILVDNNYDDIDHDIDPNMFLPTEREQNEYMDTFYESMDIQDVKVKF